MTSDQHPPATDNPPAPTGLVLVLPEGLTAQETLTGLVQAIAKFRDALTRNLARLPQLTEETEQEKIRNAGLQGQMLGYEEAANQLHEQIVTAFGLWDQYDRWLETGEPGGISDSTEQLRLP